MNRPVPKGRKKTCPAHRSIRPRATLGRGEPVWTEKSQITLPGIRDDTRGDDDQVTVIKSEQGDTSFAEESLLHRTLKREKKD